MIREAAMNSVQRQPISAKMESDYKLAEGDALIAALEDILSPNCNLLLLLYIKWGIVRT